MRRIAMLLTAAIGTVALLAFFYPSMMVNAADVATGVEGENFDVKPTGTSIVNATMYQNGQALKFTNNTAIAKETVNFASQGDVVLMARGGQSGGSPTLSVNVDGGAFSAAQPITNSGAPVAYTYDLNVSAGSHTIGVKAGNTATGRNPFVDYVTFPASGSGGTDTTPPETTITSPSVIGTTATFGFTSSEPGSTFQCKLVGWDSTRLNNCTSPKAYTNLTVGTQYTFKVWARDAAGNIDPTPATFTFTPSDGTATPAACADGRDNDGDGKIDLADPGCSTPADTDEFDAPTGTTARLVGAGDIATFGSADSATRKLIDARPDARVFSAGDNAYPDGTASDYTTKYEPAWGPFKNRTSPSPGNHEYNTSGASAYKNYFGSVAGLRSVNPTYYAYTLGAWRVYALDSNISMAIGSPQYNFVQNDLDTNGALCELAYWHHPIASSGQHGNNAVARPIFALFDTKGGDLVLNGHDHNYERFTKINSSGQVSTSGVRQIIVGTGGANLRGQSFVQPGSEVRNFDTHGIVDITLDSTGYSGKFVPAPGFGSFTDSFSGTCGTT